MCEEYSVRLWREEKKRGGGGETTPQHGMVQPLPRPEQFANAPDFFVCLLKNEMCSGTSVKQVSSWYVHDNSYIISSVATFFPPLEDKYLFKFLFMPQINHNFLCPEYTHAKKQNYSFASDC